MLFSYSDILKKIKDIGYVTDNTDSPGGDWDLSPIYVFIENDKEEDFVMISPFVDPNGPIAENVGDDQEVYAVELRTRSADSRGGCGSSEPEVIRMYSDVFAILKSLGHNVINHYDEIF